MSRKLTGNVSSERTGGSGLNLGQGEFRLDIRKKNHCYGGQALEYVAQGG